MKFFTIISATAVAVILLAGCAKPQPNKSESDSTSFTYHFENEDGWYFFHQDTSTVTNYSVNNGLLTLRTRANTYDRSKFHTDSVTFTTGTYTWRVNVPPIDSLTNTFVATWLYNDDEHELDIQFGYGRQSDRARHKMEPGQLMATTLSAGYPYLLTGVPVNPGWHTVSITLETNYLNKYVATWSIDGEVYQKATLEYGPDEYSFFICCSMENSQRYGDGLSSKDYVSQFDYVEFNGQMRVPEFYPYVPGKNYRRFSEPSSI